MPGWVITTSTRDSGKVDRIYTSPPLPSGETLIRRSLKSALNCHDQYFCAEEEDEFDSDEDSRSDHSEAGINSDSVGEGDQVGDDDQSDNTGDDLSSVSSADTGKEKQDTVTDCLYSFGKTGGATERNIKRHYEQALAVFFEKNNLCVVHHWYEEATDLITAVAIASGNPVRIVLKKAKSLLSKDEWRTGKKKLSDNVVKILNSMLNYHDSNKKMGERSAFFLVSLAHALSKVMKKKIVLLTPPQLGREAVNVLTINPKKNEDYVFFPTYQFPSNSGGLSKSVIEDSIFLKVIVNFITNRIIGVAPVVQQEVSSSDEESSSDSEDSSVAPARVKAENAASASGLSASHSAELLADTDEDDDDIYDDGEVDKDGDDDVKMQTSKSSKGNKSSKKKRSSPFSGKATNDLFSTPPRVKKADKDSVPSVAKRRKSKVASVVLSGDAVVDGKLQNDIGEDTAATVIDQNWGNSPVVQNALKTKAKTNTNSKSNVYIEVTKPIRGKDKKWYCILIVTYQGTKLWYFKWAAFNEAFDLFFRYKDPNYHGGGVATCYSTWTEVFIRSVLHGNNAYQRRRSGRNKDGALSYPVTKGSCTIQFQAGGFPLDVILKKLESNIRSMTCDGKVLATMLFNRISENSPQMASNFLNGVYRKGADANKPYANEEELKKFFKDDIEATFKSGFAKVVTGNFYNKHLCDFTIQQFLISLGYNSFDELDEASRSALYKDGSLPVWDEIEEEPISG